MRKSSNIGRARPSTISFYSTVFDSGSDEHRVRWKNEIFQILERNDTKKSLFYRLVVFSLTLTSLVAGAISTIDFFKPTAARFLFVFETFLLLFFLVELILRAFSCRTSIRFDSILLILFSVILFNARKTFRLSELSLKVLPPLQMIRFLRVDRRMTSWKILKGILFIHRQELTVTFVIAFMFLITASYLIQIAETPINLNEKSGPFRSVADTIWFSIITMTTIGFGDFYPSTFMGKMVTTTICFLGVAFWCLPVGIIGSGLAIKVQEQKRDEVLDCLVPAAASLIRNWWRVRCAYEGNRFPSSWKIYKLLEIRRDMEKEGKLLTRRKSVNSIEDFSVSQRGAIKVVRILKFSSSLRKFRKAKRPIDLKEIFYENSQMNSRLTTSLTEIQRRFDFHFGNAKNSSCSNRNRNSTSIVDRIDRIERLTNQFETRLNYLEILALRLKKN